jgi:class 3 adenylate cyclase
MIEMLSQLPIFNIAQNEMRPGSEIRLRIGIAHGKAVYSLPVDQITSSDIELAQEIEKYCASPNSIAMLGNLFRISPPEITKVFHPAPSYKEHDIVIYNLD